jgi:DNA-binding MarR family transcriptional regulator
MGLPSSSPVRQHLFRRFDAYVRKMRLGRQASAALEIVRLVFQCQHAAMDSRAEIAHDHGLTPAALISLVLLRACYPDEPVTPTTLREVVMLSSGGMTKVLRHLEERGLILRQPHPTDARSMTLVLSEAGVELIDSITPLIAEKDREMFASVLSADEMRELARLLGKVRTAYRRR